MTNREVYEQATKAFMAGDRAALERLIAPDCIAREASCLPYAGEYRGAAGLLDLGSRIMATFTDLAVEKLAVIGGDDDEMLAVLMRSSGRSIRTGKTYDTTIVETWRFRNGKVVECLPHYFDAAAVAACDQP